MRLNLARAEIAFEEAPSEGGPDSASLARLANDLTRDLMRADPKVYWADLLTTSAITYLSLFLAIAGHGLALRAAAAAVCVFALYRAASFIHELTHLRAGEAPGFRLGWNLLIGVPFLVPSLLYEGVHTQHHAKDRYGTARDPEYLPLTRYGPVRIAGVAAAALLAPGLLFLRFAVLAPLSFLVRPLRRAVLGKMSAMSINPAFEREDGERWATPAGRAQEIGAWLWSWALIGLVVAGALPLTALAIALAVTSLMALVNQLRTLGAHYWDNAGEKMSFQDQFLDSVNVPPPAVLPFLWAPVGLRFHALHHLLPRVPYHNLALAHRRLVAGLPADTVYGGVAEKNLTATLRRLLARSAQHRADVAEPAPAGPVSVQGAGRGA